MNENTNESKPNNPILKNILPILVVLILIPIVYCIVANLINNVESGIDNNNLSNTNQNITNENENTDKNNDKKSNEIDNKEIKTSIEYLDVELTNNEKISYNKMLLKNGFNFALRQTIDFENNDFPYNTNLLDNINTKYLFTLYAMIEDSETNKLFIPYDNMSEKDQIDNFRIIEFAKVLEYSKKVLSNPLTEEEIKQVNISGTKIEGNKIKTIMPAGWGLNAFVLKAKSLKKSTDNIEEILKADVLAKKVNSKVDYDAIINLTETNILNWNNDLIYANVEIVYKIINNNNKTLDKITFLKN